MESALVEEAVKQGIWALLSIVLIFYILRAQEKRDQKQEEREEKYQNIITQITEKLNVVEEVKEDVNTMKKYILKNSKKINEWLLKRSSKGYL